MLEVAVLRFQRRRWSRPRRAILTRRRDPENPQGHLWDALGYNYAAYGTDLDWSPEEIARFYDERADVEKAIHELKEDFGIDRVPMGRCLPNAADLELKVLAFNLLALYQREALQWPVLQRAKTLRRRVLALAGQLIRTAGRWVLKSGGGLALAAGSPARSTPAGGAGAVGSRSSPSQHRHSMGVVSPPTVVRGPGAHRAQPSTLPARPDRMKSPAPSLAIGYVTGLPARSITASLPPLRNRG